MSESVISQNNNSLDDNLSATEPTVEKNNGDAQEVDNSSPPKKIKLSNDVKEAATPPTAGRPGRPSKASTAKRLNILEKTAKEGEALLQNLGHKADEDDDTRRVTRSRTRGTPPAAPTPKKEKATPKTTPSKDNTPSSGAPKRRGRPPKNSISNNSVESKTEVNSEKKSESTDETNESQEKTVNNSNETNNNTSNDADNSEESNSADPPTKDVVDAKPSKEEAEANEQTNDVSAKTNSKSDDTSKSVPVLDTQQPTD